MIWRTLLFILLAGPNHGQAAQTADEDLLAQVFPQSQTDPDSIPRYVIRDTTVSIASERTLREIISRAVEGERTKFGGRHDMTYNATVRSILMWKGKKEVRDVVLLIYEDDKGIRKSIRLAEKVTKYKRKGSEWELNPDKEQSKVEVEVSAGRQGEDLTRIPFFLRNQEDYDFTLEERKLDGDHVIFKIRFRPRSTFKPLPSGIVYVDTNAFRVIHEEFTFEQNPAPLLLKDIKRVSRQWTELPGGQWVVSRIMAEMSLQGAWTRVIPGDVSVAVVFNNYRFDQGYDPKRFGPYSK